MTSSQPDRDDRLQKKTEPSVVLAGCVLPACLWLAGLALRGPVHRRPQGVLRRESREYLKTVRTYNAWRGAPEACAYEDEPGSLLGVAVLAALPAAMKCRRY